VLSVIKLADAEYPLGQVALGIEDYYLGVGEAPGVWAGRWAPKLGLVGVVEASDLRALVNGVDPRDGRWWLEGRPARKVNAFDATFSAPKSASLLWAFGSPVVASAVSRAHVEAVAEALGFLEDKAAVSRQQSGGVRTRVATDGWAVATFVHRTSRAGDPQLHTHCIVPNLVCRGDGSHASLDGAVLYRWAKAAGCVYQEQLRRNLTAELGVAWGSDVNGCREMIGFALGQLRVFSKRTSQIDAYLERSGGVYHTAVERMRADHEASLATRPAKDKELTPERLQDRWTAEAAAVGLDGEAIGRAVLNRTTPAAQPGFDEVVATLTDADSGLCADDSRFGEAHVVERVAALGAGRLTVAEIRGLAADFLASEHVVRLTPEPEEAVRTPAQWTTAAHLTLERRVLDRLDRLIDRHVDGLDAEHVEHAVGSGPVGLAGDQADAVRRLCGPGSALRSLIAPAGFGKTTAVHAAAAAASACGMSVLGVATTNRAVAELRDVGVPAITIARLALQIAERPLDPGTVLILDEASQTATADAEVILAAAEAAGGRLWCLGDVRQAQAVRAGGLAAELDRLGQDGRIPAAVLVENRRQQHPAERAALAAYRAGDVATSQAIRTAAGLEHEHPTPRATRDAMADAVAADVVAHGAVSVVALAVSHADCEDLADRVRVRLAAAGRLRGPALEGPAWAGEARRYQAGDRVLLHSRLGNGAERLHNGTVLSVTEVTAAGLSVATDGGERRVLPAEFVAGRRRDGRPNVSHGWCRTVDGAQGGTWDRVHLLGTAALDNFTGYVGQSRARVDTHTWNVRRLPAGDWGGRLADDRSGADQAADAMRRAPLKTFAAHDDPFELDRRLRGEIAGHRAVLASGPLDVSDQLAAARQNHAQAKKMVADVRERLRYSQAQVDAVGPLASLRRDARSRRDGWVRAAGRDQADLTNALVDFAHWEVELTRLEPVSELLAVWTREQAWRVELIAAMGERLDRHWARAVLSAAEQGDPFAFGVDRLRNARDYFVRALQSLASNLPPDRSDELRRAQADLAHLKVNHRHAIVREARAERRLQEVTSRRIGTRDKAAIALAQAEVTFARGDVERLAAMVSSATAVVTTEGRAVSDHAEAEKGFSDERAELRQVVRTMDAALVTTRAERVRGSLDGRSESRLRQLLGPPPQDPRCRAVWCGIAYRLEVAFDDPAAAARLAWSKDPLDCLTRGLVGVDSGAVAHAHEIIAGGTGFAIDPLINRADPAAWEQAAQAGLKAGRLGRGRRGPEVVAGLGL
jgi:conjugative relaxase-like TrwC/TraI family protein